VEGQRSLVLVVFGSDEVPAFLENLLHGPIAYASFSEGHPAGDIQALDGILLREADDADAATECLVGVCGALEDRLHDGSRVDADIARPGDDSLRCPLEMEPMVRGTVLALGRVAGD